MVPLVVLLAAAAGLLYMVFGMSTLVGTQPGKPAFVNSLGM